MQSRKILSLFTALVLAFSGILSANAPAPVQAGATNIRISQAYGGGGNSGSTYTNDFIELFNPTGSDVSLAGWSVQYASLTGSTWQVTNLTGTIKAYSYYLVQEAAGAGGTTPLPTPEVTGTIAMGGSGFKVALVDSTTALSGTCPTTYIDLVGAGSTASCFEGTAPAPAPSNVNSVIRINGGCTDNDQNSTDFIASPAAPRNSVSPINTCDMTGAPTVTSTTPADDITGVSTTANVVVNFNEPVNAAAGAFTISCTDSGAHTYTVGESNPSNVFTLDPDPDFSATDVCTVTVAAIHITDADSNDPPDTMTEDYVFDFSIPYVNPAPEVVSVTPADGTANVGLATNLTITFSEDVTTTDDVINGRTWYTLECPTGSSVASTWSGTGNTRTIDPTSDLPAGTTCTVVVENNLVTDLDLVEPKSMTADYTWSFSTNPCYTASTAIHDVQGITDTSPEVGEIVTVEGIVTADYQAYGYLSGYFLQTPDASWDTDPLTSEGIFVYNYDTDVNPGDYVRVTGTVAEYDGSGGYGHMNHQTQLGYIDEALVCTTGQSVTPVTLNLPLPDTASPDYLERYESMLVTIPDTLTVQQNYFQGRFGQLTLGSGGRIVNHLNDDTGATFEENLRRMIILDDGSTTQNRAPIPYYAADGALRAGDTLTGGLTGVLDQGEINSDSAPTAFFPDVYYRLHPTVAPVFSTVARPAAPPEVGGTLKVASYNVLNYFTTLKSRGAYTETEFIRQNQKLVNAICALDADVIGLIEIENNGDTAVNTLLNGYTGLADPYTGIHYDGLNDVADCGPYAVIGEPSSGYGTDEIKTTLIYRTDVVETVGGALSTLTSPFDEHRPPIAQTFKQTSINSVFSVVVNHFKSKNCSPVPVVGSGDEDLGVEGGCYNATRVEMANVLLDWIDTTLVPVDPDVLVIGDLNAYGNEDPINTLTTGGLIDQVAANLLPAERYSYVFDGTVGYLDHALSTTNMGLQITGVNYWHINADEPSVIDYNTEYKDATEPYTASPDLYETHPYRSSDHDPVIIGLNLFRHVYLPVIFR
ncbi:MAG: ExeM/NucH family extracellular endonuclease [Anaerolineaceae bacterium]|nr:ExeM/NucH family extracellular endonuclease [Anaerolineaceae bacterium]